MHYILVLLAVCFVWQAAVTVLLFAWKHRISARMAALLRYVERCMDGLDSKLSDQDKAVKELVDSLLLDYTQAREAANKINDFGATLANIFDYDPVEALRKSRQKVGE